MIEDQLAHRIDRVRERIEPVEHRQPGGQRGDENSAPEMKNIGMMIICITPKNDCICLMRTAIITPKAVIANASNSWRTKIPTISAGE